MNKDKNAMTYTRATSRLLGQKCFQEALVKCAKAVSLDPKNASAYIDWALALSGLKCLDKAAIKLARALQINPNFARAHYNLGLVNYHRGNYEEAQKYLKAVESLLCSSPQLLLYWGMSLQNQGKYQEAIIKWEIMITKSPRNILPYIYSCVALYCLDKHSARLVYEKALGIQRPLQTKRQIVEFLNKDLILTEEKCIAAKDEQQKECYNEKITALRFYLNKILSEWPE